MKNTFCGYVIDSVDYKDNDSIVTVLSENGLVSLRARGNKKITSKMNSILYNYAYSQFEVSKSEKSGYLTLTDGTLINYPNYVINNLDYLSIMAIVSEGVNKCREDARLYFIFKDCLKLMQQGVNSKVILIGFLNFMLDANGVKYQTDKCLNCSNKKVSYFDYDKGGFYCYKCSNKTQDINYLKKIRMISKIDMNNANKIDKIDSIYDEYILNAFESLENKCGIYFKGKEFLIKVLNMEERK